MSCAEDALAEFMAWFEERMPRGTRDDSIAIRASYREAESCMTALRAAEGSR